MDILLIAGLWLRRSIWDDVARHLVNLGHQPLAVALPGADDGGTSATHDDQLAAVLSAVDAAVRPMVVGHSAASSLAWLAADRRPENVSRVVLVGGFPVPDGGPYADFFPPVDGVVRFPGWEPFEGPDAADLDDAARRELESGMVPVPERVAKGTVRLTDERRFAVPITVICPEFSPEQARAWIDGGHVPELASAADLSLVDIDTGHWPMMTRPAALARILDDAARTV